MNKDEILQAVNKVAGELCQLADSFTEEQLNQVPFENSWTMAQLVTHILKSNNGIAQAMEMPGESSAADPGARIPELQKIFLDFSTRMKSPAFIDPPAGRYQKEKLLTSLRQSNDSIQQNAARVDTNDMISFSAFGQVTKLELLHFVLFHTQRHLHQLKNIIDRMAVISA